MTRFLTEKKRKQFCANIFNNFFSEVGANIALSIKNTTHNHSNFYDYIIMLKNCNSYSNDIICNEFSEAEVNETILMLKNNKSPGFHMITSELLKIIVPPIIKPLTFLINLSFKIGIFPKIYKQLIIVPVFKASNVSNISNYRPIALISNISKIFEILGKRQLQYFLTSKNYINYNQYGFREEIGTKDAYTSLASSIYSALDQGDKCLTIFIDIAKAFDSVSHDIFNNQITKIIRRKQFLKLV